MYRIMIVDDESAHRNNLVGLIQLLKPSYLIFSARDGKQALEILGIFEAQLLITDIKMPGIDGLTLIECAKELHPELYTIILSGYGEFNYAQRAIALGVDGYLLKPINQEALLFNLKEFEKKTQCKQEHERVQLKQRRALEQMEQERIQWDAEMLVLGQADQAGMQRVRNRFRGFLHGIIFCFQSRKTALEETLDKQWKERIESFLGIWGETLTFQCVHLNGAMITILMLEDSLPAQLLIKLRQLFEQWQEEGNINSMEISIGVSKYCDQLFEQIEVAFRQAVESCEYLFFEPKRILHQYNDEYSMQAFMKKQLHVPTEQIKQMLQQGQYEQATELMINQATEYIQQCHPYPGKFKEKLIFCLWDICNSIEGISPRGEMHRMIVNMEQLVSDSRDWLELQQLLNKCCKMITDMVS
ncbi:MAG: response regulator, partial [Clostridia bacterium]